MVAAMGLFVGGYFWGNQHQYGNQRPPVIQGVLLRPSMALPQFELKDPNQHPFTVEELKTRWTLLAFGELSQTSGHLAVTRMIEVYNRLAHLPKLRDQVQLALVAEAQSPDLARGFSRLSPALQILSGEEDELGRLRNALGESSVVGGEDSPFYLISPAGHLSALFARTQSTGSIAEDLIALVGRSQVADPDSRDE